MPDLSKRFQKPAAHTHNSGQDASFYTNLPEMIDTFDTFVFIESHWFTAFAVSTQTFLKAVKFPRCCCKNGFPVSEEIFSRLCVFSPVLTVNCAPGSAPMRMPHGRKM